MGHTITTRIARQISALRLRLASLDARHDAALTAAARRREPRCRYWHGHSGSTGCRRVYRCNVCGCTIATDAAKWRPTRHAERAVESHRISHASPALLAQREALVAALECLQVIGVAADEIAQARAVSLGLRRRALRERQAARQAARQARADLRSGVAGLHGLQVLASGVCAGLAAASRAQRPLDIVDYSDPVPLAPVEHQSVRIFSAICAEVC